MSDAARRIETIRDPGLPATPATWGDIERLAMVSPEAHLVVTRVHRGELAREEAAIVLCYLLARRVHLSDKRLIELLEGRP